MSFTFPYPGPVPPYTNVPINAEYYQPSQFFISAITLGTTTLVTTTVNHNYVIGQLTRLWIPQFNGTRELNGQPGYVIGIPNPNQVILDIDSSSYTLFQTSTYPTQPQIVAIGDINSGDINNSGNLQTGTFIPGSFINISPL
jgi:hypothetical protein